MSVKAVVESLVIIWQLLSSIKCDLSEIAHQDSWYELENGNPFSNEKYCEAWECNFGSKMRLYPDEEPIELGENLFLSCSVDFKLESEISTFFQLSPEWSFWFAQLRWFRKKSSFPDDYELMWTAQVNSKVTNISMYVNRGLGEYQERIYAPPFSAIIEIMKYQFIYLYEMNECDTGEYFCSMNYGFLNKIEAEKDNPDPEKVYQWKVGRSPLLVLKREPWPFPPVKYLGCFVDRPGLNHALNGTSVQSANMKIDLCISICIENCFLYAGLQNGDECHCDNSGYDKYGEAPLLTSDCDMECPGNTSQSCGGVLLNEVYQVYYLTLEDFPTTTTEITTTEWEWTTMEYWTDSNTVTDPQGRTQKRVGGEGDLGSGAITGIIVGILAVIALVSAAAVWNHLKKQPTEDELAFAMGELDPEKETKPSSLSRRFKRTMIPDSDDVYADGEEESYVYGKVDIW